MKEWKDGKKMPAMQAAIENDINNRYGLLELYSLAAIGLRASINDGRIVEISRDGEDDR